MAVATSPESLAVQKNRTVVCKLIVACADTTWFAGRLVEESFITSQVQANVTRTRGMSDYEKCSQLLDAVEVQLIVDPRKFQAFLEVFSDQPALQAVADALRQSFDHYDGRLVVRKLSCDSSTPPESEISIPECNIQFSLFITELTPLLENHEGALCNILTFLEQLVLPLHSKCLAKIFQPEKFQGVQSIRDLFRLLAPHWGYIDCSLLHPIVKASGCKPALAKVEEFLHNRKQLSQVLIVQKAEKHQPSSECNTALSSSDRESHHLSAGRSQSPRVTMQRSSAHEEVVEMKVETNVVTLKDYEENASLLSNILGLPRYVMSFFSSGTGSISLKWLISKQLVPYVHNTRICTSDLIALAEKHVTEIKVGSVYQITIPSKAYWQEGTILPIQEEPSEEQVERLLLAGEDGDTEGVAAILKQGTIPEVWLQTAMQMACESQHSGIVNLLLNEQEFIQEDKNKQPEEQLVEQLRLAFEEGSAEAVAALLKQGTIFEESVQGGEVEQFDPSHEQTETLFDACKDGRTSVVESLLKAGVNPNLLTKNGGTGLNAASGFGHTSIVEILLNAGVHPDLQDKNGVTGLHAASLLGHTSIAEILLNAGAHPDLQDKNGVTGLYAASCFGHTSTVEILLNAGAQPDLQTKDGATALIAAAQEGRVKIATLLVDGGANINFQRNNGDTALLVAAGNGHASTCTFLIERGGCVEYQNNDGDTALIAAARIGHASTCTALIERGAHVDCQDNDGHSALYFASCYGHTTVIEILLKAGADLNIPSKNGHTALVGAAISGHASSCALLIERGARVDHQEKHGMTALFAAAQEGHRDIATLLLEGGAQVNLQTNDEATALMAAARNGHASICTLLIERGARVNLQDNIGRTALWFVGAHGHTSVLEVLLKSGGDLNIPNKNEYTALMAAAQEGHANTAALLIEGGARVDLQSNDGWTALFIASLQGHSPIVEALLMSGAHINTPTEEGLTPLIAAVQNGHTEVVKQLLHAQADTNIKENSNGWTALHFAAKIGQIKIVQLLLQHGVDAMILDLNQLTALDIAEAHSQDAVYQELQPHMQQNVPTEVDVRPQQHAEDSHSKSTANGGREEEIESMTQQSNTEKKTAQLKATRDRAQKAGRILMALFGRIEDTLLRNRAEKRAALLSGNLQGSKSPSSFGDPHGKKQIVVEIVD